jgi:hypothetical protein
MLVSKHGLVQVFDAFTDQPSWETIGAFKSVAVIKDGDASPNGKGAR